MQLISVPQFLFNKSFNEYIREETGTRATTVQWLTEEYDCRLQLELN